VTPPVGPPERGTDDALEGFYSALLDDDPAELYERAPCGYLSTTPDGTIVQVNGTFLTWTGYAREQLVARRQFSELLSPGGRIYHETHYAPMLRMQGTAKEIALEIVCADGSRMPVLVNSVLERDEAGEPIVVRTAVFDASERREYERELLRAKQRAEESERRATMLARTLQRTLIPPAPPIVPGLDLTAAYRPAGTGDEVGGDFYDVFELGPGDWMLAVGDVRGKGVEAAVVTALARHTIRAAAVRHPEPSEVLLVLNDVLRRDSPDRFCTVALVRLRHGAGGWTAQISCGGHPQPIGFGQGGDPGPAGRTGTLLGVFDAPTVHDTSVGLGPGAGLVLFTDGITESRRGDDFFGDERLLEAVARHRSAADLSAAIVDEVFAFQTGPPVDDIVVVSVRVAGGVPHPEGVRA
jgi:sigma-B regulation protein RsbU (phosphoserine phosphatase)